MMNRRRFGMVWGAALPYGLAAKDNAVEHVVKTPCCEVTVRTRRVKPWTKVGAARSFAVVYLKVFNRSDEVLSLNLPTVTSPTMSRYMCGITPSCWRKYSTAFMPGQLPNR